MSLLLFVIQPFQWKSAIHVKYEHLLSTIFTALVLTNMLIVMFMLQPHLVVITFFGDIYCNCDAEPINPKIPNQKINYQQLILMVLDPGLETSNMKAFSRYLVMLHNLAGSIQTQTPMKVANLVSHCHSYSINL